MDETFYNSIKDWRKKYEDDLGAPDGWFSIAGLFWLEEGENRIGTDFSSRIVLPRDCGPKQAGVFTLHEGHITLQAAPGVEMICNDQPVTTMAVKLGQYGSSEWIHLDRVKFVVIQRGVRYGVRVYDPENPARRKFLNLRWFVVNEDCHIEARFVPCDQPLMLSIMNVLGDISQQPCPGSAEFTLDQQPCKLYPVSMEDGRLWFMFKDASNGKLTYPGGRFLFADPPQDGKVILDFNKAFNPPCAYTHFATCPLPPEENKLAVQVLAGEMEYIPST
jgi:uncharacterized protein